MCMVSNWELIMKRLVLSLAILLVLAVVGGAIPNPSAVYCTQLGYQYEVRDTADGQEGYCIFPDGTECSAWQYYCKCQPEGTGCWPGDLNCDRPCKELPCKEAGEDVLVSQCCEGLSEIPPAVIYDDDCNTVGLPGALNICSDCGNGICESWESKCNCPQDCGCADAGEEISPKHYDQGLRCCAGLTMIHTSRYFYPCYPHGEGVCDANGCSIPPPTSDEDPWWQCTPCGNGICESECGENRCNCEEDCECSDIDEDNVCDWADNCPDDYNPDQEDRDDDGLGNVCDSCQCSGDENGDGQVDLQDLAAIATILLDAGPPFIVPCEYEQDGVYVATDKDIYKKWIIPNTSVSEIESGSINIHNKYDKYIYYLAGCAVDDFALYKKADGEWIRQQMELSGCLAMPWPVCIGPDAIVSIPTPNRYMDTGEYKVVFTFSFSAGRWSIDPEFAFDVESNAFVVVEEIRSLDEFIQRCGDFSNFDCYYKLLDPIVERDLEMAVEICKSTRSAHIRSCWEKVIPHIVFDDMERAIELCRINNNPTRGDITTRVCWTTLVFPELVKTDIDLAEQLCTELKLSGECSFCLAQLADLVKDIDRQRAEEICSRVAPRDEWRCKL